jgi:hypothetical protein
LSRTNAREANGVSRNGDYLFRGLPRDAEDDKVAGHFVGHVVVAVDALTSAS